MKNNNKGYSLIEIITVFAVAAVFAVVAVSAVLNFTENGRQTNRMNIARTLYLSAQNRLTELKITKTLKPQITNLYYNNDVNTGKYTENLERLENFNNVYKELGNYLPPKEIESENQNYVHYIYKEKGDMDINNHVVKLLEPVILDKDILNNAILIEYNIETGMVLSVFYGDAIKGGFQYDENAGNNNIIGKRGMGVDGYSYASSRKQGYYGVDYTGNADTQPGLITIKDSYLDPLPDDIDGENYQNVLYSEIFIPQKKFDGQYDLFINNKVVQTDINLKILTDGITSLETALINYTPLQIANEFIVENSLPRESNMNTTLLYRYDGDINLDESGFAIPDNKRYARVIWILDYVGGDMSGIDITNENQHSIGKKYREYIKRHPDVDIASPEKKHISNMNVHIEGNITAFSSHDAHPYFFTDSEKAYENDNYTINSARHLYNMRYLTNEDNLVYGVFTQKDDIDFAKGKDEITNFQPIPEFHGTYNGTNFFVKNLKIDLPHNDIGLFSTVNSKSEKSHTIENLTLEKAIIEGKENTGGIAGINNGNIVNCLVSDSNITGSINVGGITGRNISGLKNVGVKYSSIKGTTDNIGGITGQNNGIIEDVFFLSTDDFSDIPISEKGGGIVGYNKEKQGAVSRALYLAIAPFEENGQDIIIYPIVRKGDPGEKNGNNETCFYLAGARYSLNEGRNWTESKYNRPSPFDTNSYLSGGGAGLITNFIEKDWLNFSYKSNFSSWEQPTKGYPYPIISGMKSPTRWSQTESAVRPDQKDRSDWEDMQSTTNRAGNIGFLNGEFDLPVMNPNNPLQTRELLTSDSAAISSGNPWRNNSDFGAENIGTYANNWQIVSAYNFEWVQGWLTRPVYQESYNDPSWKNIELLVPWINDNIGIWHGTPFDYPPYHYRIGDSYGLVRTNYKSGVDGVYAELNATTQNTLYQICNTAPGTTVNYSFYHATRHDYDSKDVYGNLRRVNNAADLMYFYLSGVEYTPTGLRYTSESGGATLIRPCETPRGNYPDNITTRDSVKYGKMNLPYFKLRDKYIYDVWNKANVNDDDGFGVTFWSDKDIDKPKHSDIENDNIIGYWDVTRFKNGRLSEWKQYYGLYTVPAKDETTEFAYESQTKRPAEGNFLDGITFKSPAFLSVDKYPKINNIDVTFVKPNEVITIEFDIKNWGEMPANNIVISDSLSPFMDYISFEGGITAVKNGINILSDCEIITPSENNGTISVKLPENSILDINETMKITFKIKVRNYVINTEDITTLLYYFKNQANVEYSDYGYKAYENILKKNSSGPKPVHVSIDPIKLTKTVKPHTDGPFEVTMKIENTMESGNAIETTGLITDVIPAGFEIKSYDFPGVLSLEKNTDGSTRITVTNVDLDNDVKTIICKYTLEYNGDGYGVSNIHTTSNYKYLYKDGSLEPLSVMLDFPMQVVGIKIKTKPDVFTVKQDISFLDITRNSNFSQKLFDGNYDVDPVVVLTDKNGNEAIKNPDGEYQIITADYTATLLKSTNMLKFELRNGAKGNFKIHYKIILNATKPGGTPEVFELSSETTEISVVSGQ